MCYTSFHSALFGAEHNMSIGFSSTELGPESVDNFTLGSELKSLLKTENFPKSLIGLGNF